MARADIDRTIRRFVAAGSGLANTHVIPTRRMGPAPKEQYATVLIFDDTRRGFGRTRYEGTTTQTRRTFASRRITASVQWLRKGSGVSAERFMQWTSTPAAREWCRDHGLTFQECGPLRDLSMIFSESYEERWGLDLTVDVASEFSDTIGTVGSLDVEVDVRL